MQPDPSTATWRRCTACGHETAAPDAACPRCGQRLLTPRTVRRLGWVLVVIGTALAALMGALLLWFHRVMDRPSARFTGTPEDAAMAYLILGLVLAFGLVVVAAGLWQIRFGRRHRFLPTMAVGLLALVELIYATLRWLAR